MKILGIDPGIKKIGFAVTKLDINNKQQLINFGIFKINKKLTKKINQLNIIFIRLHNLIKIVKPDLILFEKIFIYKNINSIITIAQIQGLLYSLSYKFNIQILELNPTQIKKILIKGNATKEHIKNQIQKKYPIIFDKNAIINTTLEYDAFDAIAINNTYIQILKNFNYHI